tara:strand:- start:285 stop:452 length:168 start_codon:yes stop_codon:yes gene_type:complete
LTKKQAGGEVFVALKIFKKKKIQRWTWLQAAARLYFRKNGQNSAISHYFYAEIWF